jgi:hypothetical protein
MVMPASLEADKNKNIPYIPAIPPRMDLMDPNSVQRPDTIPPYHTEYHFRAP